MAEETNPFRMSMLNRSQTSLNELDAGNNRRFSHEEIYSDNSNPPSRHASVNAPSRKNPFKVDLSEPDAPPANQTFAEETLPPSYDSVKPPSGGSGYLSASEEKQQQQQQQPPSRPTHPNPLDSTETYRNSEIYKTNEGYRRGFEEGMRHAKEQERRKRHEMRARRRRQQAERGERVESVQRSASNPDRPHRSASERRPDLGRRTSSRNASGQSSKTKDPASIDVIDKLDVTGVFSGSGFHHDGPFDACAPHRNKQSGKAKRATPISAFPADGPNNSLAVVNPSFASYRTAENVYGRHADISPEEAQTSFDPTDRGAKVHGERTMALGSTTFLDGTPASRDAIAANEEKLLSKNLGRSKSVLRSKKSSDFDEQPKGLLNRVKSLRVGRH